MMRVMQRPQASTEIGTALQIIHMANDSSLVANQAEAAADPQFMSGSGLASATPSSTMRGALEAMHSVDLGHPNIVQTYKSTQRAVQVGEPVGTGSKMHTVFHVLHTWHAALSPLPPPCRAHACRRILQLALNKLVGDMVGLQCLARAST